MEHNPPELAAGVREGDILAGKYRVERVLGTGGMGVVVAAHHVLLDERVAIKFLHAEYLANSEVIARFKLEARAAAKIRSEHVGRVLDVGVLESGVPYIVMEYLEGFDLAQRIQEHGSLPIDQAIDFILQACEALAEVHGLGIVHRDLKPANLFCSKQPGGVITLKILDFGISKSLGWVTSAPQLGMTRTNSLMGSPLYMSPEQIQSARTVDARTDIWALGVILYEMLSGKVPFDGDSVTELCARIITQPPAPLVASREDVPPALEETVRKCLAKRPEERYATVADLALDLAPFAPVRCRASVDRIARVIYDAGLSEAPALCATSPHQAAMAPRSGSTVAPLSATRHSAAKKRSLFRPALAIILSSCVTVGGMAILHGGSPHNLPSMTASESAKTTAASGVEPDAALPPKTEYDQGALIPPASGSSETQAGSDLASRSAPVKPPPQNSRAPGGSAMTRAPSNSKTRTTPAEDPLGGQY